MTYYRIKKEHDNRRRSDGNIFVGNELYTPREKEKYSIPDAFCDVIEVSRKKTYFFFGARFCD